MKKLFYHRGFTLTEMLIAVTIFVLVIIAVYSSYALSQRAYREGERVTEITQNGRVILERLAREIRQAKEIRQSKEIDLPGERASASDEIIFHDGHSEFGTAGGGSANTINLGLDASGINDYYKNMTIQIIEGTCSGQLREIIDYDGTNRTATLGESWEGGCSPDGSSKYEIFGSYHYIHYYFQSFDNSIRREVIGYYVSGDSGETLVSWDTDGIVEKTIEPSKIIGEWVNTVEFWGSSVINIALTLTKKNKSIDLQTKVYGRNL